MTLEREQAVKLSWKYAIQIKKPMTADVEESTYIFKEIILWVDILYKYFKMNSANVVLLLNKKMIEK